MTTAEKKKTSDTYNELEKKKDIHPSTTAPSACVLHSQRRKQRFIVECFMAEGLLLSDIIEQQEKIRIALFSLT